MKLRLTQEGFASYSGQMGVTFFKDGLSTADVRMQDAVRMAAVMLCEWEDGTTASVSQAILDNAHTPAPMVEGGAPQHDAEALLTEAVTPAPAPAGKSYSEDELSAIADQDGIKGLRVISDTLNIKGNSIKELIREVVAATAPKA